MTSYKKLLTIPNSQLAWVLRLGLSGLQTQLQQALHSLENDPGEAVCQEILQELSILLSLPDATTSPGWQDILEPLELQPLADSLLTELSPYIGDYQFHSSHNQGLEAEIQGLLLRVPEKIAQTWLNSLPISSENLYNNLHKQIPFDTRLQAIKTATELDILTRAVSIILYFVPLDTYLHHALKSLDRFGIRPLTKDAEKYTTALIERFHRVQATIDGDAVTALRARLDLDEAIHSLVYLPVCDRYSWWGKLQQEARQTLDAAVEKARDAGNQVQIRPLWGTYADICKWSKDDLQVDGGGVPGEVTACLRVYAKINQEILPGRVLFRSL
ncbi:hypothetical protein [Calothrix sp. 336/3]|uniref:hypothetical protein n=1 Tax=Calothrix sp. 336/3 TaxID=1337936 RepID=UPI0004E35BD3|nr:hypothetical protein [Calothrix sp. 336/3]AKG23012.1 hypothetical protein IJ00_18555 [Calothrix sp. 336/3]